MRHRVGKSIQLSIAHFQVVGALAQGQLGLLMHGHVAQHHQPAACPAAAVFQERGAQLEGAFTAFAPHLELRARAAVIGAAPGGGQPERQHLPVRLANGLRRQIQQALGSRVHIHQAAAQVQGQHGVWQAVHQGRTRHGLDVEQVIAINGHHKGQDGQRKADGSVIFLQPRQQAQNVNKVEHHRHQRPHHNQARLLPEGLGGAHIAGHDQPGPPEDQQVRVARLHPKVRPVFHIDRQHAQYIGEVIGLPQPEVRVVAPHHDHGNGRHHAQQQDAPQLAPAPHLCQAH